MTKTLWDDEIETRILNILRDARQDKLPFGQKYPFLTAHQIAHTLVEHDPKILSAYGDKQLSGEDTGVNVGSSFQAYIAGMLSRRLENLPNIEAGSLTGSRILGIEFSSPIGQRKASPDTNTFSIFRYRETNS